MEHYSDTERLDAETVETISQLVCGDASQYKKYYSTLFEIFLRIPVDYRNQFEHNGLLYIKFWKEDEYRWFLQTPETDHHVEPLPNAYPKCCYLLSIIWIEQGKYNEALAALVKGLELEPDHPLLLCQMGMLGCQTGKTYGDPNLVRKAFFRYAEAFSSRIYNTPSQKARALRGLGYVSVELNEREKAERYYEASLMWHDADNARRELDLIRGKKDKTRFAGFGKRFGF